MKHADTDPSVDETRRHDNPPPIDFPLRGEFVTLDRLLKATGLAQSGGAAKAMVADGRVQVDGREELRKTCKIRAGQVVSVAHSRVRVVEPTHDAAGAAS
jgi:ribosome-associated protein